MADTTNNPLAVARRLLALAEQATPGPWEAGVNLPNVVFNRSHVDDLAESVVAECNRGNADANAAYIAACSPDAITAVCRALVEAHTTNKPVEGPTP